jgi:uracil-DNA glycosylase family 4
MSNASNFQALAGLTAKARAFAADAAKRLPSARVRLAQPLAFRQAEALASLPKDEARRLALPVSPLPAEGTVASMLPQPPYAAGLVDFQAQIQGCERCALGPKRRNFVFGAGPLDAQLVFVGDAPGRDEDLSGKPFAGAAGQLLDRIIAAMGTQRSAVYLCNVVKCRPVGAAPLAAEAEACLPYLEHQLGLLKPKVIVTLGELATLALLGAGPPLAARGRFGAWRGITVMPTLHPSALLRDANLKRVVWDDMKLVVAKLKEAAA